MCHSNTYHWCWRYSGAQDDLLSFCLFVCLFVVTRPPLPVYGIALLVVAVGILVVAMVLLVVMAFKKSADHKKRQRAYSVTMGTSPQGGVAMGKVSTRGCDHG